MHLEAGLWDWYLHDDISQVTFVCAAPIISSQATFTTLSSVALTENPQHTTCHRGRPPDLICLRPVPCPKHFAIFVADMAIAAMSCWLPPECSQATGQS